MKGIDLTSRVFNRLTVIDKIYINKNDKRILKWKCLCECGNYTIVSGDKLKSGHTKSCGCLNKENSIRNARKMGNLCRLMEPQRRTAYYIFTGKNTSAKYNDGDLHFDEFIELIKMKCHYCGGGYSNYQNWADYDKKSSQYAKDNGGLQYNGLDRMDSSLPHNKNNVVPCCKWCNFAKNNMNYIEFIEYCKKLIKHLLK